MKNGFLLDILTLEDQTERFPQKCGHQFPSVRCHISEEHRTLLLFDFETAEQYFSNVQQS
jgi:hypothetical protein